MKRTFVLFFLALASFSAFSLDNKIRILSVYTPQVSGKTGLMDQQLDHLKDIWQNSNLISSSGGITIEFANNGNHVPYPEDLMAAPMKNQVMEAFGQSHMTNLRAQYAADLVVIFTKPTEKCGAASSYWTGSGAAYLPKASTFGLDLRGANDKSYVVGVDPDCPRTVAHEIGHVHGGQHFQEKLGLYSDSHAYSDETSIQIPGIGTISYYFQTSTADENITMECAGSQVPPPQGPQACVPAPYYSNKGIMVGDNFYGDDEHENVRAISLTALSVANYWMGDPPQQVLEPPVNLYGLLIGVCSPSPWTQHEILWQEGGSTAPVEGYEIWYIQAPYSIPVYGWTVTSESTPAFVYGAPATTFARTCNSSQCSGFASSFYVADWLCGIE